MNKYCDTCIHKNVCGLEGANDESIVFCSDWIEGGKMMDINKIHDAMKVLKDECKKYKACKDCIFYDSQDECSPCYLDRDPSSWEEDKIVENNCTTVKAEDEDEWYQEVLRCTSCERLFMLDERDEGIVGCYCPYCGKKIVRKEENA